MQLSLILHVYKDFAPHRGGGGVARHIDGLAVASVEQGYRVDVAAPSVEIGPGTAYSASSASWRGLWRRVREADVVHVHGSRTPISAYAALLARLQGRRLVYTPHCYYDHDASRIRRLGKRGWDQLVERFLLRSSHATVLLAPVWQSLLREKGLVAAHPVILPNCVEDARMHAHDRVPGALAGRPSLLSVGRLDPVKRLEDAIRVLRHPGLERAVLHLVGKGPDRSRLESVARDEGVAERVVFHGFVADEQVAAMVAGCDAFLMPSAVEGMPTVLIEMILSGCPVVASDIPGNRAILAEVGLEGALYPLADVAAMAARIAAHAQPSLSVEVRERTREAFTWERMGARIRALYGPVTRGGLA